MTPETMGWLGAIAAVAIAAFAAGVVAGLALAARRARHQSPGGVTPTVTAPAAARLADASATDALHPLAPRPSPSVTASETSPKALVLVVDDEPGIREFIGQVLTRAGHEFVAVATPSAALAALRSRPRITLMVVDVVMPDMDGYELATAARQMAPGLPVVFTSAFAPEPGRVTSGDRFLGKPFTAESLIAIIDESR